MGSFRLSEKAEEDLLDIWLYIAEDSQQAATRVIKSINNKFQLLAKNPKLGTARPDIRPEMRFTVVGSYLILYKEIAGGVEVVRVLHGARNLYAIFDTEE